MPSFTNTLYMPCNISEPKRNAGYMEPVRKQVHSSGLSRRWAGNERRLVWARMISGRAFARHDWSQTVEHWTLRLVPVAIPAQHAMQARQKRVNPCCLHDYCRTKGGYAATSLRDSSELPTHPTLGGQNVAPSGQNVAFPSEQDASTQVVARTNLKLPRRSTIQNQSFCCAHPTLREMFWTLFMYLTLPQDLSTTQMTQHKMLGFNVGKGIQLTWTPWTIPKHLCLNTGSRFLTVAHLLYSVYSIHVYSVFLATSLIAPFCSFGWLEGKAVMRNGVSLREFTRWLHEPTWESDLIRRRYRATAEQHGPMLQWIRHPEGCDKTHPQTVW